MASHIITFTGITGHLRDYYRSLVTSLRAQYSGSLAVGRTTHLVVPAEALEALNGNAKLSLAQASGIPVVSLDWLDDSAAHGFLLSHESYVLRGQGTAGSGDNGQRLMTSRSVSDLREPSVERLRAERRGSPSRARGLAFLMRPLSPVASAGGATDAQRSSQLGGPPGPPAALHREEIQELCLSPAAGGTLEFSSTLGMPSGIPEVPSGFWGCGGEGSQLGGLTSMLLPECLADMDMQDTSAVASSRQEQGLQHGEQQPHQPLPSALAPELAALQPEPAQLDMEVEQQQQQEEIEEVEQQVQKERPRATPKRDASLAALLNTSNVTVRPRRRPRPYYRRDKSPPPSLAGPGACSCVQELPAPCRSGDKEVRQCISLFDNSQGLPAEKQSRRSEDCAAPAAEEPAAAMPQQNPGADMAGLPPAEIPSVSPPSAGTFQREEQPPQASSGKSVGQAISELACGGHGPRTERKPRTGIRRGVREGTAGASRATEGAARRSVEEEQEEKLSGHAVARRLFVPTTSVTLGQKLPGAPNQRSAKSVVEHHQLPGLEGVSYYASAECMLACGRKLAFEAGDASHGAKIVYDVLPSGALLHSHMLVLAIYTLPGSGEVWCEHKYLVGQADQDKRPSLEVYLKECKVRAEELVLLAGFYHSPLNLVVEEFGLVFTGYGCGDMVPKPPPSRRKTYFPTLECKRGFDILHGKGMPLRAVLRELL